MAPTRSEFVNIVNETLDRDIELFAIGQRLEEDLGFDSLERFLLFVLVIDIRGSATEDELLNWETLEDVYLSLE